MRKSPTYMKPNSKVMFVNFIIHEFAAAYKMNVRDAYFYLKKYGGLSYLYQHLWALHTDNPYLAVRDMFAVCRNNGGLS